MEGMKFSNRIPPTVGFIFIYVFVYVCVYLFIYLSQGPPVYSWLSWNLVYKQTGLEVSEICLPLFFNCWAICSVDQTGLELTDICLPLFPNCWD